MSKAPLSETLQGTLDLFGATDELSASEVRGRLSDDVGETAINNRLARLRELGYLDRRRVGRELRYRRHASKKPSSSRRAVRA